MKQAEPVLNYESTIIRNAFGFYKTVLKGVEAIRLGTFAKEIRHRFGTSDLIVKETVETLRKHKDKVAATSKAIVLPKDLIKRVQHNYIEE